MPAVNSLGQPLYFSNLTQPQYNASLAIVKGAQAAWVQIVQQFAAENLAMGIQASTVPLIVTEALQPVNEYGSVGNLWAAFDALSSIVITTEMSPYITSDRVVYIKNQIINAIASLQP